MGGGGWHLGDAGLAQAGQAVGNGAAQAEPGSGLGHLAALAFPLSLHICHILWHGLLHLRGHYWAHGPSQPLHSTTPPALK